LSELAAVFARHEADNYWGNAESLSGDGSTLAYTYNLRRELSKFIRAFRVTSMFDAPCGDFNWMQAVDFPPGFDYLGGDIVASLIEKNRARHGREGRRFVRFDISADPFPDADLWFCRDCLFHLPNASVLAALEGFARSRIGFMMATTHLNVTGFDNTDIAPGGFRLIDLHKPPYRLPREVFYRIPDYVFPYPQRELAVWSRAQVRAALGLRG
jgi:SAM-dependent methyltransferase